MASDTALLVGLDLIGVLINTLLYGFVLGQFLTYFNNTTRAKDTYWIRGIVWGLFFLDTLHSAVEFYAVWDVSVNHFGDLASFAIVSWVIPFTATADAFAALMTQTFLIYRVYMLKMHPVIVAFLIITSVLSFAFGCTAGIYSGVLGRVDKFAPLTKWVILWLTFQSAADLGISISLIISLLRSRTGFRKTDTMINRLIIGAIETGVFAAAFAMGDLFSFTFFQTSNLYLLFAFPIGRIYTNTLLHVLNSRDSIRNASQTTGPISLSEVLTDNNRGQGPQHHGGHSNKQSQNISFPYGKEGSDVEVDTTSHTREDSADYKSKSQIMVGVEQTVHVS
ncbi:hypothetical protein R3P38DRAFT_1898915 [Favolaschia claudopus]|uniref:DUF6534 domain-containing protein n=1 Tax=Favolaschia claudopus TaxID=2862362 RepID=A0AAW0A1I2_9AGAR